MTTVARESPLDGSREAAEMLGVHVETIRRGAREGTLPAVRLRPRGNLYFGRADLDRLVSSSEEFPR